MNKRIIFPPLHYLAVLFSMIFMLNSPLIYAENSFRVITTIKPIHSILAGLMDGTEGPELLINSDATPFGYSLSEKQNADILAADVIIWIGPELERFMIEPVEVARKAGVQVFTLLDNIQIKVLPSRWAKDEKALSRDPYIWMDSRNTLILVDELAKILMEVDAGRAHLYRRNRGKVLARVAELDRQLEYGYRGLKSGIGMTYYDTLQYFEQAYALKIREVMAESPETPIQASKLLLSRVKLKEGYYTCLLTEYGMPMPELPLLTEGISINIGLLDSFGTKLNPGPDLYFELMKENTDTIKQCLQYSGQSEKIITKNQDIPAALNIGGKFMLIDHKGNLVTEKDLQGKYQLIYFGYTFCPDICPTSLQVMSLALDMLGDEATFLRPYFITIDPERDNQKVMNNYVDYFNKDLVGLTGTVAMIGRVAEQFKVKYEKVLPEGGDPNLYTMDHSSSVFLMAPDGEFITKFAHGISAQQMVEGIRKYLPQK